MLNNLAMAQYKSNPVTVHRSAESITDKFADLSAFGNALDAMSPADRERIGDVKFEKDSITIDTKQVGTISFKVTERTPSRIVMNAVGSPVPLDLCVNLTSLGSDVTEIVTSIDVEIPAMLRPLIGGAMQKAVDQFGDLMGKLNS
ncbi:MAG: hypothetical protein K2J12_04330 [Muribaculaceae bacterium]|nr:hypothetical protein [Muribaculaceae bacterium]